MDLVIDRYAVPVAGQAADAPLAARVHLRGIDVQAPAGHGDGARRGRSVGGTPLPHLLEEDAAVRVHRPRAVRRPPAPPSDPAAGAARHGGLDAGQVLLGDVNLLVIEFLVQFHHAQPQGIVFSAVPLHDVLVSPIHVRILEKKDRARGLRVLGLVPDEHARPGHNVPRGLRGLRGALLGGVSLEEHAVAQAAQARAVGKVRHVLAARRGQGQLLRVHEVELAQSQELGVPVVFVALQVHGALLQPGQEPLVGQVAAVRHPLRLRRQVLDLVTHLIAFGQVVPCVSFLLREGPLIRIGMILERGFPVALLPRARIFLDVLELLLCTCTELLHARVLRWP